MSKYEAGQPEVRATDAPSYDTPERHFFYSGLTLNVWSSGGRFVTREHTGKMKGKVKILPLKSKKGFFSLRSIGRNGTGALVHIKGDAMVISDGIETTVESHYWRIQKSA